jgi:hypothetical protein
MASYANGTIVCAPCTDTPLAKGAAAVTFLTFASASIAAGYAYVLTLRSARKEIWDMLRTVDMRLHDFQNLFDRFRWLDRDGIRIKEEKRDEQMQFKALLASAEKEIKETEKLFKENGIVRRSTGFDFDSSYRYGRRRNRFHSLLGVMSYTVNKDALQKQLQKMDKTMSDLRSLASDIFVR